MNPTDTPSTSREAPAPARPETWQFTDWAAI